MGSIVASGKMLLTGRRNSLLEEQHDECFDKLNNHLKSKRELLETVRPRYLKANKLEKQKILDEFSSASGYHRKYAIRLLKNTRQGQKPLNRKSRGYPAVYHGETVQALEQIWEICGRICSKRLQPFLPEAIKVLERCQEIELTAEIKARLLKISSASIDRCLRPLRNKSPHGLSTTKPGSLLKKSIAVRTFTPWNEEQPGFMEIDLVAHCGESTAGLIEHFDLYRPGHRLDGRLRPAASFAGSRLPGDSAYAPKAAFSLARHRFG